MRTFFSLWRGVVAVDDDSTLAKIAGEVADKHGLTVPLIRYGGRARSIAWPRMEFYYRALRETQRSSVGIGLWCGGRDHSTVLTGADVHAERNGLPPARTQHSWLRV